MTDNNNTKKVTKFFSRPLWKQDVKSNLALCVAVLLIMVMMTTVINFARSIIVVEHDKEDVTAYQEEFYTYLGALATSNAMMQTDLSYEDFSRAEDFTQYEKVFGMMNSQAGTDLSVDGFQHAIDGLVDTEAGIETYVREFEYAYALSASEGVFSGEELTVSDMLNTTLEMMGVSADLVETMSELDTSAMLNQMYYTVMGPLPIFLLIVILANSLIASQVDRGSMAYVLSTPTKRSAVVTTQMLYLIAVPFVIIAIVCAVRIGTSFLFYDEVNVPGYLALFGGMYILTEAVASICFLGSCLFSQSRKALGFGGGLTAWFFISSLLGLFGSEDLVSTGMGVEELGIFNKLTLVGLYDNAALETVGTDAVDTVFIWKLAALLGVAVICYGAGAVRFTKKDLPL